MQIETQKNTYKSLKRKAMFCIFVIFSVLFLFLFLYKEKNIDLAHTLKFTAVYCFLIPVAIIDYKQHIIPNRLLPICILIAVLWWSYEIYMSDDAWTKIVVDMIFGLTLGGGVFAMSAFLTKGGVGMGDVKLFSVLGLALGFQHTFYLILTTLFCATLVGAFLITTKRAGLKSKVPVGPFVLIAFLFTITLG